MKPHIVQSTKTDFSGKANFKPVAAGTYYLMGLVRRQYAYVREIGQGEYPKTDSGQRRGTTSGRLDWNVKIDLKPGQNFVTLDQDNAYLNTLTGADGFGLR